MKSMADVKGDVGEIITASSLRSNCDMTVVRNIYLPYKDHFTEVDMVAIGRLGIFVIENKNYDARITGSIQDKYWNVEYSSWCSYKLYNPLFQNKLHKQVIMDLLSQYDLLSVPVYKPVIFNDKGSIDIRDGNKYIFTLSNFISAYNSVGIEVLDSYDISNIAYIFKQFSNPSDEMKLYHKKLLSLERCKC